MERKNQGEQLIGLSDIPIFQWMKSFLVNKSWPHVILYNTNLPQMSFYKTGCILSARLAYLENSH